MCSHAGESAVYARFAVCWVETPIEAYWGKKEEACSQIQQCGLNQLS